jgi:hypothetical protein
MPGARQLNNPVHTGQVLDYPAFLRRIRLRRRTERHDRAPQPRCVLDLLRLEPQLSGTEEATVAVPQISSAVAMPLPGHKPRSAVASPGSIDSKGAALRRGDLKISEPIRLPHDSNHGLSQQFTIETLSPATAASKSPLEGTWPRKSVSPGFHSRTRINGANEPQTPRGAPANATSRTSAGPSIANGSLPSGPSKNLLSKQKESGLKAKIRRMFGSRRVREATSPGSARGRHSQNVS